MTQFLVHNKMRLALHALREAEGRSLLLLHGLGERSPAAVPAELDAWPGAVHALDFTGHGASSVPRGGGYTAEILMHDVDMAVAHLGHATIVGRGLGAYVGLLIAGGRPEQVRGVILRDGPGLEGGGARGGSPYAASVDPGAEAPPDPYAFAELSHDIRPPDYAASFARLAAEYSGLETPITVCALARPDWLAAIANEPGVEVATLREALRGYAAVR